MDIKPKFKIGDKITYKYLEDLENKDYYYKGVCCGGQVGEVVDVLGFNNLQKCYDLQVTNNHGTYRMCECEFLEYNKFIKPKNGYFFDMVVKRRKRLNSLGLKPKHIKKYH